MDSKQPGASDPTGEQRLRDAARALAEAAGQFGHSFGAAGTQAEAGVTKGLLAAAQALAQASAWVEQRSRPLSTKERLLEQAARLFAERGYAGVSLEDIAQSAGFTKGAVYSHFGSKEQTFLAALRAETAALAAIRHAATSGEGQPDPDAQPAPVHATRQEVTQGVTLALEAMMFGQRVPERRAEVREIVAVFIAELAAAERTMAAADQTEPRVLDRDEAAVGELAMRTLLLGLAAEPEDATD